MTIKFIRIFFLFLGTVCGYYIGSIFGAGAIMGAIIGFIGTGVIIFAESKLQSVSLRNLSAAVFGLIFGFFMAWVLTLILRLIPMDEAHYSIIQIIFTLVFCYLGMTISIKGKDEFNLVIPYIRFSPQEETKK